MLNRHALLLASAFSLGVATPAAAQHHHADAPPLDPIAEDHYDHHGEAHDGRYEGSWQGDWQDDATWQGEWVGTYTDAEGRSVDAAYRGVFIGEHRFVSDDGHVLTHDGDRWHGHSAYHRPRLAYSARERAQWLADCQYLMADGGGYHDERANVDGRAVGGVLGAIGGGIAGNRIADGNRLLGTVAGAGIGALAGAAIGSALDSDGDGEIGRNELWAARYCEAYLRRHELGGGEFGYLRHAAAVPGAYGQRHGHRHRRGEECRTCREVVTEEWVEVESEIVEERPRRVIRTQRPRGKRRSAD